MADVVLNQEGSTALFSGNKKVITHYNNVSDSSGSTTKILDISDYSNAAGDSPVSATFGKTPTTKSASLMTLSYWSYPTTSSQ